MKTYNLYLIKNIINSQTYIGYTEKSLQQRFKQHIRLAKSQKGYFLHNAIRKYGDQNFIIELIYTTTCIDDIREQEIRCIVKYNSLSPDGYNIHIGGLGGNTLTNHPQLQSIKKLMSERHLQNQARGKDHPLYIQYSQDIRKQVVEMYFSFEMYSPLQIIKKFNISSKDVFNRLIAESNNKLFRSKIVRFKVNKNNLQKLYNLYFIDKKTTKEISMLTNLADGSICAIIKQEFHELINGKQLHQTKKHS